MKIKKFDDFNKIFESKKFVITNGKEWYAGSKGYCYFGYDKLSTNLYKNYDDALNVINNEIPNNVVEDKKLKIEEYTGIIDTHKNL